MTFGVRPAVPRDVAALVAVKGSLRVSSGEGAPRGGFLLGTDAAGYQMRIAAGGAWVLEAERTVVGFAIVLPDAMFRESDVWTRRDQVDWVAGTDPTALAAAPVGYFDQLAVRSDGAGARRWGAVLACRAVRGHFDGGHENLLATTVTAPIENRAAVPYLERVGGARGGRIAEHHEAIGDLVSDVWVLPRVAFERWWAAPRGRAERWIVSEATA